MALNNGTGESSGLTGDTSVEIVERKGVKNNNWVQCSQTQPNKAKRGSVNHARRRGTGKGGDGTGRPDKQPQELICLTWSCKRCVSIHLL